MKKLVLGEHLLQSDQHALAVALLRSILLISDSRVQFTPLGVVGVGEGDGVNVEVEVTVESVVVSDTGVVVSGVGEVAEVDVVNVTEALFVSGVREGV